MRVLFQNDKLKVLMNSKDKDDVFVMDRETGTVGRIRAGSGISLILGGRQALLMSDSCIRVKNL